MQMEYKYSESGLNPYHVASIKLSEIEDKINLPQMQRDLVDERVEDFKDIYKNELKAGCLNIRPFSVAYHKKNKTYYLIDGQHRYRALLNLYNNDFIKENVSIMLYITEVSDDKEMKKVLKIINSAMSMEDLYFEDIDEKNRQLRLDIVTYFKTTYPSYFKTSSHPRPPHFNNTLIDDAIERTEILSELQINSLNEFIMKFEKYHRKYYRLNKDTHSLKTNIDMCDSKQGDNKLYINIISIDGFFTEMQHYYQKKREEEEEEKKEKTKKKEIKKSKNKKESDSEDDVKPTPRVQFTKHDRDDVFKKTNGKCFTCDKKINKEDMIMGHINAIKYGGSNDISNIMPVCETCNSKMGTMNMYEFRYNRTGKN